LFSYGKRSESNLCECVDPIQKVFRKVIQFRDCAVLEGYRGEAEQNYLCKTGASQVKFPKSNHNVMPSRAADVVPYPIDWSDIPRFREFAQFVLGVAAGMGIKLRWGGDWKNFKDMPHFYVVD